MGTADKTIRDWAVRPAGKLTRIVIALAGMSAGTTVLIAASLVERGSWALVLGGVFLAWLSVRTATQPSLGKLSVVGSALIALPLLAQVL